MLFQCDFRGQDKMLILSKMARKAHPTPKDSISSLSRWLEVVPWNEAFVSIFSSLGGLGSWDDFEHSDFILKCCEVQRGSETNLAPWGKKTLLVLKAGEPSEKRQSLSCAKSCRAGSTLRGHFSHSPRLISFQRRERKRRGCRNHGPELAGSRYPSDNSMLLTLYKKMLDFLLCLLQFASSMLSYEVFIISSYNFNIYLVKNIYSFEICLHFSELRKSSSLHSFDM